MGQQQDTSTEWRKASQLISSGGCGRTNSPLLGCGRTDSPLLSCGRTDSPPWAVDAPTPPSWAVDGKAPPTQVQDVRAPPLGCGGDGVRCSSNQNHPDDPDTIPIE
ncbi:UNVERIFIED_CONTAM: hypothetical protein FKN15_026455 [Acipenser sinensis]